MSNEELDNIRKAQQIQDSMNTGQLEQALAMQKQEEQNNGRDLLDVTEAKAQLKKALLGKQLVYVPQTNNEGEVIEGRYRQKWQQTSEKQLMNQRGFDIIWSEVESFLNENITGSYLPAKTIENMCKGTMKTVIRQIMLNHEEYDIDSREDASEIVDIVRSNLIANTNKSRGGRGLKSKEKTVIEKISRTENDEEQDSGGNPLDKIF